MHEFSGIVNAFIKHMFDTSNQSHLEGDGVRKNQIVWVENNLVRLIHDVLQNDS